MTGPTTFYQIPITLFNPTNTVLRDHIQRCHADFGFYNIELVILTPDPTPEGVPSHMTRMSRPLIVLIFGNTMFGRPKFQGIPNCR